MFAYKKTRLSLSTLFTKLLMKAAFMKVYKYTNRKEILENGTLRFTQPDELNDPLEGNPNFKELMEDIKRRQTAVYGHQHAQKISKKVDENADQVVADMLHDMSSTVGFLSLTKRPNNNVMWGNYADSHKGFVLGFDSDNPFFKRNDARYITGLRDIKYSPGRPVVPGHAASGTGVPVDLAELLFFTKSDDWAYEDEVRAMAKLASADVKVPAPGTKGLYLFRFPPDSLLEIIFGLRTSDSLRQEIIRLAAAKYPHAQLLQTQLRASGSDLDIVPYS